MKRSILAAIICCCTLLGVAPAWAENTIRCDVLTIEASRLGSGVEAPLRPYAAIFKQKPFDAFDSFKLVDKKTYELTLGASQKLKVPGGMSGKLLFKGLTGKRLELRLTLNKPGLKPITIDGLASPGAPLFAAGFRRSGRILIFGVACTDKNGEIILN